MSVQSMTNVPTSDLRLLREQVSRLASLGAELVRVSVPDASSAESLPGLLETTPVPIAADIHFDPGLAMAALKAGVHKLRLNPGNIGRPEDVRRIAAAAAERCVPIRIGVNSGSLPGDLRERYGVSADAMWAAAERHLELLEAEGFEDVVLSLKASDPLLTVEANRRAARERDYPLHLGVTEAGPPLSGAVRSAAALSVLLSEGIGDTVRVSLSGPPEMEPGIAWELLTSLRLRERRFPRVVSCPTCARARLDVAAVARAVQEGLAGLESGLTVAVMGCEVNGPGEAAEADVALVGTPAGALLFVAGRNAGPVEGGDACGMAEAVRRAIDSIRQDDERPSGG